MFFLGGEGMSFCEAMSRFVFQGQAGKRLSLGLGLPARQTNKQLRIVLLVRTAPFCGRIPPGKWWVLPLKVVWIPSWLASRMVPFLHAVTGEAKKDTSLPEVGEALV